MRSKHIIGVVTFYSLLQAVKLEAEYQTDLKRRPLRNLLPNDRRRKWLNFQIFCKRDVIRY